jgi:type IV pilus assembly protein PilA
MEQKINFQALKSLLVQKRSIQGFTLAELLVVVIIMTILAGISLPALLGQAAKARESSGKMSVGLVNRAQARYRPENQRFATSFDDLAIGAGLTGGTTSVTEAYSFQLSTTNIVTNTSIVAYPSNTADRSYIGGNLMYNNSASEIVIVPQICESDEPVNTIPPSVIFTSAGIDCPSSYHKL